ncbi:hypothetical protein ASPZODRAFT_1957576 [Penicilliopsis zonata CBS 506.65]|uniref:Transmembrane protein n=1 Tax=Penicilliopsis zonata CBS 506.65 TaxID=1073090 RepID=A0A1L9SGI7_9EURO|nr:hypothetical protein ASPZODRAFT_1957576 [Penicilliopsis zonata CBS 506.65]OJJ46385.1 hypothetical protein ASPZODRAFT_1957576 [Penicilliopsis zonata CBS 506.65]
MQSGPACGDWREDEKDRVDRLAPLDYLSVFLSLVCYFPLFAHSGHDSVSCEPICLATGALFFLFFLFFFFLFFFFFFFPFPLCSWPIQSSVDELAPFPFLPRARLCGHSRTSSGFRMELFHPILSAFGHRLALGPLPLQKVEYHSVPWGSKANAYPIRTPFFSGRLTMSD